MKRKTDRVYGAVFQLIRAVARQQDQFTRDDVAGLSRMQFNNAVIKLCRRGELVRRRPGRQGRGYRRAIFAKL